MNEDVLGAEQILRLENFLDDDSASSNAQGIDQIRAHPISAFSGETLRPRGSLAPGNSSSHICQALERCEKSGSWINTPSY